MSTNPFGASYWLDYHAQFLIRYGPGALVPITELTSDAGLGFPGGYLGAPRARPAWRAITDWDAAVLTLVQGAALDDAEEVCLSDADVDALAIGDPREVVPPRRIELGVAIHAASTDALQAGDFRRWVTAAPRSYTDLAGRFTPLLNDGELHQLAATYRIGDADGAETVVQLSFAPRRPANENVVRVPPLMMGLVALAEPPSAADLQLDEPNGTGPTPERLQVDDLAVTADSAHMCLVHRPTGRRVVPRIPHALEVTVQTPPLARFLAEVAVARQAVYGPFDFGAARTLPYLPRLRYRRTVLAAARWNLDTAPLNRAGDGSWRTVVEDWRRHWRIPERIVLCTSDLRLPLDLTQPLDLSLLRHHARRTDRLEIHEAPPPEGERWIGRPAEFVIPMVTATKPSRPFPPTAPAGGTTPPGGGEIVHVQLAGNPRRYDDLITDHLPQLVTQLGPVVHRWLIWRHRSLIQPELPQHLGLFLRLADAGHYGVVAARLADFATELRDRGLPAELTLAPYDEHPGRYGTGPALLAAEQVLATDTAAARAQIALAHAAGVPAQALAAASMTQLATALARTPAEGYRALLDTLGQTTGPLDRNLRDATVRLADPADQFDAVRTLPGGEAVIAAWTRRHHALADYRQVLARQRDPSTVLRTLLHGHHVRALGVDADYEKTTNRLARAAALHRLAAMDRA